MRRNTVFTAVLVVSALLSGCFSLDTAPVGKSGEEHVVVSNYGWALFNSVPVVCGNATSPEKSRCGACAFFRNDVTMNKLQGRLLEYAAKKGRTASDLVYHDYDSVFFELPLFGISIPIPYLVCYHELQLSGVIK